MPFLVVPDPTPCDGALLPRPWFCFWLARLQLQLQQRITSANRPRLGGISPIGREYRGVEDHSPPSVPDQRELQTLL